MLHSGDFRNKNGPFFICFKTKKEAQAFLEATDGELEVDLSAADATILLKMYIDANLKDHMLTT